MVITQPLTFVATCNAISYCHAEPVFIDVDRDTMGLSAKSMSDWLEDNAYLDDAGLCREKRSNKVVRACLPMHTFGHPADIDGLLAVCDRWHIGLIEDAAESLGSLYKGRHTGTFGDLGTLSFNGNKIITTGGGGMILADAVLGARAKHLTTTAKQPHAYEYVHDAVGYNYRLPNINAALGCAQMEQLETFVEGKRALAGRYQAFLEGGSLQFVAEREGCRANYWLNAVICEGREQRDALLHYTNGHQVMTRPIWSLMNELPMYNACRRGDLVNAEWLAQRIVNLPSSVPPSFC
ncbi:Bacillosamine/Legionaminic acid biosynthesis aminotransferase PglE; 4-keto-6-deoxy-N-Acetyl-D-hexosaminyl-(Lipid carrier) aminotransferase [plant metagenome]|uniref:Bacillosamine/Legionaminic acid biosynthesis aminotransferase PglE 4-keto-6-deoxy-N-Acetyl-D-hexosaminyl-(Lipid carrier) aminotransferase n=1 Tax=plant metagenome TaxID=1297885 RepID=A0A484SL86_9ZZZZ